MLAQARTHAALPAADLDRARRFYEEVLGLVPAAVTGGGVLYGTAEDTRFLVFPSAGRAAGTHTQMGFTVADIGAEVADLKRPGVTFESYAMPQFDAATSIATFPGSRPLEVRSPGSRQSRTGSEGWWIRIRRGWPCRRPLPRIGPSEADSLRRPPVPALPAISFAGPSSCRPSPILRRAAEAVCNEGDRGRCLATSTSTTRRCGPANGRGAWPADWSRLEKAHTMRGW